MSGDATAAFHLAAWVRALRARRGWSQEDMAAKMTGAGRPMSQQTYARIESAIRATGVDDLAALARVFGTSMAGLLAPVDVALGLTDSAEDPARELRAHLGTAATEAIVALIERSAR